MVKGLELFRDEFKGFEDCYTLIGGAACELWMDELGLEFRKTTDLDIVLVFEGQRPDFVAKLWAFIKQGGYLGYQAGETPSNFYRFHKPRRPGFPSKLEISTKHPVDVPAGVRILRIPAGEDVSSLSAILLDGDYFDLVRAHTFLIQGVSTVTATCLIPLKAKAWLNLSETKARGEAVDQKQVDKHRNDVFRLLLTVAPADMIGLVPAVQDDLRLFINQLPPDSPTWGSIRDALKSNKLTLPPIQEAIQLFKTLHGLA